MHILHSLLAELKAEFAWSKKGGRAWIVVYLYPAGNHPSFYILQNVESPASLENPVRFCQYQEETILHLHGFDQDPMEIPLGKGLADDT